MDARRERELMTRILPALLTLTACATIPATKPSQQTARPERLEGMWAVNGTNLHYVIVGTGDPIVVLHGGPGGNLRDMLELAEFAPDYRWVFYDQRGSGESDRFPSPF